MGGQCGIVMEQLLIIKGALPGRNESEKAARSHWAVGAKLKKDNTDLVMWECKTQKIKPVQEKARVEITFYEKDMRRDSDNVYGGLKYILDGLVKAGVIKDDSRRYIDLYINPVELDRQNPRIEIKIKELVE